MIDQLTKHQLDTIVQEQKLAYNFLSDSSLIRVSANELYLELLGNDILILVSYSGGTATVRSADNHIRVSHLAVFPMFQDYIEITTNEVTEFQFIRVTPLQTTNAHKKDE